MPSGQLLQAWPMQWEPFQRLPSPTWLLLLNPDPGGAGRSRASPGKSPGNLVASRRAASWGRGVPLAWGEMLSRGQAVVP